MSRLTFILIALMMVSFFACEEDLTMATDTLKPTQEINEKSADNNWHYGSRVYTGRTSAWSAGQLGARRSWTQLGAQYTFRNTPLSSEALDLPLPLAGQVSSPFEGIELSKQSVQLASGKRRNYTLIEFFLPPHQFTIRDSMLYWPPTVLNGPGRAVASPSVGTTFNRRGEVRSVVVYIDERFDLENRSLLEVYDLAPEANVQHLFTPDLQLRVEKNPHTGFYSFVLDGLSS